MEQYEKIIEKAVQMDDLSFMRLAKQSDDLETALNAFSAVFDEHVPESIMHVGYGGLASQFAKMDVQLRQRIFNDWLSKLQSP
ncbi:hypothetical protein C8D92_102174 [Tamilnaduibacter salinus]|uniref:Uncharacterized protein n=1 Tax=Tamilnaduibacter salinus TaxID=1484056 RepID=A0A2A2I329_9GAMM|nr:hypothetical protein [Tamilnaduibacter salinus]PAV26421.1 hypothetical protein CF392_06205 [Tamilnaduibacter salinus]PVY78138.1 hypothetical protein C8D92_102174 [Tamilnaduibacter salinus]